MKKHNILISALVILLTLGYFTQQPKVSELLANSKDLYSKIKIFTSVLETIQRSYLEYKDSDELIQDAINGVISNLDPHTVYLPAEDFKTWNQSFEGYTGIGISFEIITNKITIMSVIDLSPAFRNGIEAGDQIISIDGHEAVGMKKDEVIQYLKGGAGTQIALTVDSKRWAEPRELLLTRERITLKSIPYALMLQEGVGYIKIEKFAASTAEELDKALDALESQGLHNLILDLRGNSGGYLNAAIDVADKFISDGNIIVSTKGRFANSLQKYYTTDKATRPLYPMVVLIDHGSASASEIVAGAIQDLDRGLIIGKTSFGKGLVQSQYRFHDGSALLITTAKYYTPSGRPIQRNYLDKSKEEYYRDAYNDDFITSARYTKGKPVFKTASGRTVYGGGGITPDIWVENDDNTLSDNLRELFFADAKYFYVFGQDYINQHPKIKQNQKQFIKDFLVTDEIYQQFCHFLRKSNSELVIPKLVKDKKDIKFLLKREMAYLLWGREAQFRVNIARDKQLHVAINHLSGANKLLTTTEWRN